MEDKYKLIINSFGSDKVKENQLLSEFTTLKNSGVTRLFFVAFTQREIIKMVEYCRELKIPFLIFGSGSKMLISDNGFSGVSIKNRTKNIKIVSIKGKVGKGGIGIESALVEVESGLSLESFVEFLDKQGLVSDVFTNTKGSIGGNLFVNKDLQDKVESLTILNQNTAVEGIKIKELSLQKHIILSVIFKLKSK